MTPLHPRITRWRAAAVHLAASVVVAALAFATVRFSWYPGELFEAGGGRFLFLLMVVVLVAAGPLLTLIVFVPRKKGLAFDLATIAVLQVAALAYGTWVTYQARPAWIVFVKDRFELVRANQRAEEGRAEERGWVAPQFGGPALVGARLPQDAAEQLRIAMSTAGGVDVQHMPRYYVPYDAVAAEARTAAQPLERLEALNPRHAARAREFVANHSRGGAVGFLPVRAWHTDLTAAIGPDGRILELSTLLPWKLETDP